VPEEVHALGDSEPAAERLEAMANGALADDQEADVRRPPRDADRRVQEDVESLLRLQATDAPDEASAVARGSGVARMAG